MEKLTIADLNELIYRIGTSIKNNTTQEVFYMTKEEAEFLRDRLTTELEKRNSQEEQEIEEYHSIDPDYAAQQMEDNSFL